MWELDHKEGWAQKNGCFWTVEKTLESPLDCKEIQSVNLNEICSEYSLEGLMLKLKLQLLWPPDVKSWLTGEKKKTGHWKRLRARRKGDDRGWGGWMASLTQGTWVWANSTRWLNLQMFPVLAIQPPPNLFLGIIETSLPCYYAFSECLTHRTVNTPLWSEWFFTWH